MEVLLPPPPLLTAFCLMAPFGPLVSGFPLCLSLVQRETAVRKLGPENSISGGTVRHSHLKLACVLLLPASKSVLLWEFPTKSPHLLSVFPALSYP